jgi:hypothetical protein
MPLSSAAGADSGHRAGPVARGGYLSAWAGERAEFEIEAMDHSSRGCHSVDGVPPVAIRV